MKKEYRIVATKYEHHNNTGKDYYRDAICPRTSSFSYTTIYQDLADAQKALKECKKALEEWERSHNANALNNKMGVMIHFSALRIENREVSEWEEV